MGEVDDDAEEVIGRHRLTLSVQHAFKRENVLWVFGYLEGVPVLLTLE